MSEIKYRLNKKPDAIILDIEGTTTPFDFVHKTLFGYIRKHIADGWIKRNESTLTDIGPQLMKEHEEVFCLKNSGRNTDIKENNEVGLDQCILELMGLDIKSTSLKQIQATIMKDGYKSGELKSQLFDDVTVCIQKWKSLGIKVYIYSSGSVEAQKLLFSHTESGDITSLIDGYFDTRVGSKLSSSSYLEILRQIGFQNYDESRRKQIVFITDNLQEVHEASQAGLSVFHIYRPGNPTSQPSIKNDNVKTIQSFHQLEV